MSTPRQSTATETFYHESELFAGSRQPVLIQRFQQSPTVRHRHDFTELVLILSGQAQHETSASNGTLAAGDFFAVEGEQFHSYIQPEALQLINVIIRRDAMERLRPALRGLPGYRQIFSEEGGRFMQPRRLLPQEMEELLHYVGEIGNEATSVREGRELAAEALLTLLLVCACRLAANQLRATEEGIVRALRYMEVNFQQPLYLKRLEELSFLTGRSLQRRFHQTVGMTPMQYLLHIRLTNAARLLRETVSKTAEIAADCGFTDSAYFLRQFKRATGITPGEYRRRLDAS